MRRMMMTFVVILAFVGVTALPSRVAAQQVSDIPSAAELRKDLQTLGQVFGIDAPKEAPKKEDAKSPPPASVPQKNMADVADRALTMVEGVTARLSDTLKGIAPEVWRIMLKQQYAKAIAWPVGNLAFIALCLLWGVVMSYFWKSGTKPDTPDDGRFWFTKLIPLVFGTVGGMFLAYNLSWTVLLLINPEYYAIQDLLKTLLARPV